MIISNVSGSVVSKPSMAGVWDYHVLHNVFVLGIFPRFSESNCFDLPNISYLSIPKILNVRALLSLAFLWNLIEKAGCVRLPHCGEASKQNPKALLLRQACVVLSRI